MNIDHEAIRTEASERFGVALSPKEVSDLASACEGAYLAGLSHEPIPAGVEATLRGYVRIGALPTWCAFRCLIDDHHHTGLAEVETAEE